jgi:preprotein translocase subunit YajC
MLFSIAWAETAANAASQPTPSMLEQMFPYILILGAFFYFIIRPAQKRSKQQQDMVSSLKRGDNVITSGGILGKIEGITEQFITLEIADGVRIRILKNQIAGNADLGVAQK